ncbi:DUF1579 family protein [Aurantiacibacter aquimixticola]|uniref:DUF1579 domain-containing protein n=1 Tax=Aurantiacibacter aquimixticola TaxID=1958945 RepID=A0A419RR55_9SPHN|nr:DUF1579 family protein [Aurantiacibacter aquimixticola]RJY08268.1 DUF1579 domain-containing protein [Aurantiacibacter aquimixticola]
MGNDKRFESLARLVGSWKTTITMHREDGATGDVSHATDVYSWSANRKFLHHDVDADMGGQRHQSFEVIALNPSGEGFVSRSYDPDGSFSDYSCWFEGPAWNIEGAYLRFSGQFSESGDVLSGQWEQLTEAGHWQPFMKVMLRRNADEA